MHGERNQVDDAEQCQEVAEDTDELCQPQRPKRPVPQDGLQGIMGCRRLSRHGLSSLP